MYPPHLFLQFGHSFVHSKCTFAGFGSEIRIHAGDECSLGGRPTPHFKLPTFVAYTKAAAKKSDLGKGCATQGQQPTQAR